MYASLRARIFVARHADIGSVTNNHGAFRQIDLPPFAHAAPH